MKQYEIYGIEKGKSKKIFLCSYELSKYQWALKLIAFLEDKGFTEIELKEVEVTDNARKK